uniref:Uncharacterized protein n=1 Tax=Anguilla anguilla TaxID=7936 RepID=A0A0E9UMZ2_ANGAN
MSLKAVMKKREEALPSRREQPFTKS